MVIGSLLLRANANGRSIPLRLVNSEDFWSVLQGLLEVFTLCKGWGGDLRYFLAPACFSQFCKHLAVGEQRTKETLDGGVG